MTAAGADLLHDPAGLRRADAARLLPAVATAGAQVRAIQASLADLPATLDPPRALVVAGPRVAAETALLAALVERRGTAPIVAVEHDIPSWVGALDIVVVLAAQVHDPVASLAAETASRRGATVVVRAARGTPSPGPGAIVLAPQIAVSEALATPARLALLTTVAHRAGLLPTAPDLALWADVLDATALACHPSAEEFVNPAVSLAEHLWAGTPLIVGCDPVGDAVAGIAGQLLADLAGVAGSVLTSGAAGGSPAVLRRAAAPRDVFADPFADPVGPTPPAAVLVTLQPDGPGSRSIAAALPTAPVLAPDQVDASSRRTDYADPVSNPAGTDPSRSAALDRAGAAAELILRMSFAASYLGLAAGQLPPLDAPDGLGPTGTALGAVRAEERGAFAPERDLDAGQDGADDTLDDDFLRSIGVPRAGGGHRASPGQAGPGAETDPHGSM